MLFYAGRYYTQIVSTKDDPKFAAFALELAKRVASLQKPGGGPGTAEAPTTGAATDDRGRAHTGCDHRRHLPAAPKPEPKEISPATYFALLPAQGRDGDAKYVAQDVFGYSFLSDVFMADYKEKDVSWQGFLRPYRDAEEAKAVFEKYIESVKKDGAEVKTLTAEGADEMVIAPISA